MEGKKKILIVDKDAEFTRQLTDVFTSYGHEVLVANNSREGIALARANHPQVILLELLLDELDGIEICMELRNDDAQKEAIVLLLSDRKENYTQIAALNAGADDFLIKPINHRLLLYKVNAWLRRATTSRVTLSNNCDLIQIDRDRYLVIKDGSEVELPRKEFEILSLFIHNPRKVFSRDEIKGEVWGTGNFVKNRTIDVHIMKLRDKIGDQLIKTIKGVGYKLDCC